MQRKCAIKEVYCGGVVTFGFLGGNLGEGSSHVGRLLRLGVGALATLGGGAGNKGNLINH